MSDDTQVEILSDGTVRAKAGARDRFAARRGDYRIAVDSPRLLLLRKEGESDERVLMAGELLTRMTVMEILNFIATANWRGELHILGESQRVLLVDQAALKGARSQAPDERLGETLFQQGILTRAEVDGLAADVGEKRFGELCVERGFIDSANLYSALQKQAESIFFGALLEEEGHYIFTVGGGEEESGTTMHIPVHGLLMEGVQRIDEMALFRDKIPSSNLCPQVEHDAPPPKKLDTTATAVLRLCNGALTIEDIAKKTGFGEFSTTKAVYHLLQQKQITLRTPSVVDPGAVVALVARFNEVLQDIFVAVATYGGLDQTRDTLTAWIVGSGYGPFFGESLDEFGGIDPHHVADALQSVSVEHPLEALHQALHELAAFALFSATTTLPRDQELSLARDVNARLKAIRIG